MLTLTWAPSGAGPAGPGRAAAAARPGRRWRTPAGRRSSGRRRCHLGALAVGAHADDVDAGDELGAPLLGRRGELRRHRAHATDGDVPVAGAAADDVVQEATVGEQVVGVGERADQGVGQHDAAQRVVGEVLLDRLTDRPLDEHPPCIVADEAAEVAGAAQRLGQRREHPLGHRRESPRRAPPRTGVDERDVPASQRDVEAELVDDLRRQQADEVRVLRQQGVVGGEHASRAGRPADHRVAFEHEHRPSGLGEVRRTRQPVVPATDDDGVVRSMGSAYGEPP